MKPKILIIGSGQMALEYVKAISNHFNYEISILTKSKARGSKFIDNFNLNKHYLSINDVDLSKYIKIIVCTSEKNFLTIAKHIANFNGEVLFEKPLGLSLKESIEIAELNRDKFFVALNRRFYEGINELKSFIGKRVPIHGIIMDQQSIYDWNPRRLQEIDNQLVYSNSIHILDLTLFILNEAIDIKTLNVKKSNNTNKNISKYNIQISNRHSSSIDYIRHNNIPGKWQIYLFYKNFIVHFENLENFKVLDSDRKVLLSSPNYHGTVKQGLKPMLNLFLSQNKIDQKSLPLAIQCIDTFKILNKIKK